MKNYTIFKDLREKFILFLLTFRFFFNSVPLEKPAFSYMTVRILESEAIKNIVVTKILNV
jgi:hypothetical protein